MLVLVVAVGARGARRSAKIALHETRLTVRAGREAGRRRELARWALRAEGLPGFCLVVAVGARGTDGGLCCAGEGPGRAEATLLGHRCVGERARWAVFAEGAAVLVLEGAAGARGALRYVGRGLHKALGAARAGREAGRRRELSRRALRAEGLPGFCLVVAVGARGACRTVRIALHETSRTVRAVW